MRRHSRVVAAVSSRHDNRMNTSALRAFFAGCAIAVTALAQYPGAATGRSDVNPRLADPDTDLAAFQAADGTVLARGPRFRAELTAEAVSLSTPEATSAERMPTLRLRYLGTRRGDRIARVTARRTPQLAEHTVRYDHGDVVETYRIDTTGFEQSFVVGDRPAGHGDLVLDIAVEGNVTAPPVAPAHQALEFSHDGQRRIRYGAAVAFERGGAPIEVLTAYDGVGHLQLIVPAAFVESARFPIVVDPVVTPTFIPSISTNLPATAPDVAYDIESDCYMMVWRLSYSPTTAAISGKLFTNYGSDLSAEFSIGVGTNDLGAPSVALCNVFATNAFLVVWQEGSQILGRLMSTSFGAPLANEFVISSPLAGERDRRPTVSGPGSGAMMVAWDRTNAGATNPSRIVMRHMYWPNPNQPANVSMSPEQTLEAVTTGWVENARLARSDVRRVVSGVNWFANRAVWSRFYPTPAPGDSDIRTVSFRVKASPFAFAVIDGLGDVPGGADIGPSEILPDIGGRASLHSDDSDIRYLIAWEDEGDVLAHMMDLDGAIGSPITVQDDADYQGQPAVGAGFCEFSVGYLEVVPPAEFDVAIRAARVLLDGTVAITDRLVDDPGPQFQSQLRASSRPIHTVLEHRTNRVLFGWRGQTGPSSAIDQIRATFFEPVDYSVSPFGNACPGPLGELPAIGTWGNLLLPWVQPLPGNDTFRFTVTGAPPTSLAVLVVSDQLTTTPIPGAPGCFLYAGLPLISIFPAVTDAAGDAEATIAIPCSIPNGAALAFQWAILAPTANAFGWIVSNDLDLSWSHF